MNRVSLLLGALMMLCMVVLIAPGILALNHGKILRNTALWLAVFLGLGLMYKNFGPDSPHPLVQDIVRFRKQPADATPPAPTTPQPATDHSL